MHKLLIISGQTATGKTGLGVYLAEKYNGEIVSFDSRQAYTHLDILTGKDFDQNVRPVTSKIISPAKNVRLKKYFKNTIPIWLYDLLDPQEILNAYDFCAIAEQVIEDILKRKKVPIIVGGTVFYIKTFLENLPYRASKPDWQLRNKLENWSVAKLQKKTIGN